MFKIKQGKKSGTTLSSLVNCDNINNKVSQKRVELGQNNDLLNIHSHQHLQEVSNNQQFLSMTQQNPVRNASLRPRSGLSKNLPKYPPQQQLLKQSLNDQQLIIQQRIKHKALSKLNRPSTSTNLNENSGLQIEKKNRLINRRGTLNQNNTSSCNNIPKSMKSLGSNTNIENENILNNCTENGYFTNQHVLSMINSLLDTQEEYLRLKQINEQQFDKIKQRIMSNVSIIVLKWYKILQDKLYNQVKTTITSRDQPSQKQQHPSTIQQLIQQQVKKHFLRSDGLFTIQQRCQTQESKLSQLIDKRLTKLQNLLTSSSTNKIL